MPVDLTFVSTDDLVGEVMKRFHRSIFILEREEDEPTPDGDWPLRIKTCLPEADVEEDDDSNSIRCAIAAQRLMLQAQNLMLSVVGKRHLG